MVLPEPSAPTSSTRRIPSPSGARSDEIASPCRPERGGADTGPLAIGALKLSLRGPPSRDVDSPAHAAQMKAPAGPATSGPTSPRGLQQKEHQAGASGSAS